MARDIGGFGRLPAPLDGRDFNFLMRAAMPQIRAVAAPKPRKRAYNEGPLLNQGTKPHCVAYSGLGFLNAAPLMRANGYDTTAVYQECQRTDEWEGEQYDGTSVRALMKVLSAHGYISSYVWGQTVEDAIAWTNGGYGTLIVGTDWFQLFDDIGADGFMRMPAAMATPIGGHAYRLNWYDKTKGGFLVINSWSTKWGIQKRNGEMTGRAYMGQELFTSLMLRHGECAAPTQIKIAARRAA